jgi:hypothetical protein
LPLFLKLPYEVQMELDGLKLKSDQYSDIHVQARLTWSQITQVSGNRSQVLLEPIHQKPEYQHETIVDDKVIRRALLIADFYPKVCIGSSDKRVRGVCESNGVRSFSYKAYNGNVVLYAQHIEKHLTSITG